MVEVEQEAPSTPVAVRPDGPTVEVEVKPKRFIKDAIAKVATEVKDVEEKVRVEVSDAEKNVALRMENEFLKVTAQISNLQNQADVIKKNFPEYLKGLATKYGVDIKTHGFDLLEGAFKKTPTPASN